LVNNSNACVPAFVQMAGIAALTGPQDCVRMMRDEFKARRDVIVAALNAIPGVACAAPNGAFYAFPSVSDDAQALADRLLSEQGVACLAGAAFGPNGAGHLRFSYVRSREAISEAMRRFSAIVKP
jgi:aspartate/methionine/tyrosine aminotransferase